MYFVPFNTQQVIINQKVLMNRSYTPIHSIHFTNQFHGEMQADIGRAFREVCKNACPGKQALRNVLGFSRAYEVVPTFQNGSQQVIIN
jgi:hypothetical protein